MLVVDDEESVRVALRRLLTKCGYRVLVAEDGGAALDVEGSEAGAIDLLLTDMVMPRMGGRELADEFLHAPPTTKIVYMSGYTQDETLRSGVLARESAFLRRSRSRSRPPRRSCATCSPASARTSSRTRAGPARSRAGPAR